jgi:hypothetical protein
MRFSSSARSAHLEESREGGRSRARGPAHPGDGFWLRSRARRIYPNGESDIGGRGARLPARLSAHALPIAPPAAAPPRPSKYSTPSLPTRAGAGMTQSVGAVVGAFTGGGGDFIAADWPLPRSRARVTLCVSARRSWFPVRVPFAPVRVRSSRVSLEVAVGDRGERWGRSAVHRRASVHICAVSSAVPVPVFALCYDETVEIVSRARVGSNGAVFCIGSLTGIMDGP